MQQMLQITRFFLLVFLNTNLQPVDRCINALLLFLKGLEAHKYKSTLDCAMKILRYEGLAA